MLVHEIQVLTLSAVEIGFTDLLHFCLGLVKQLLLVKLSLAKLTLSYFNIFFELEDLGLSVRFLNRVWVDCLGIYVHETLV